MLKKVLFASSLVVSSGAFAGGWTGDVKVSEIYPAASQNGVLIKLQSMSNPDNCPSADYYVLDKEEMFFDKMFSLLASAQARKSTVNIRIHGCKGANSAYPAVTLLIAK